MSDYDMKEYSVLTEVTKCQIILEKGQSGIATFSKNTYKGQQGVTTLPKNTRRGWQGVTTGQKHLLLNSGRLRKFLKLFQFP